MTEVTGVSPPQDCHDDNAPLPLALCQSLTQRLTALLVMYEHDILFHPWKEKSTRYPTDLFTSAATLTGRMPGILMGLPHTKEGTIVIFLGTLVSCHVIIAEYHRDKCWTILQNLGAVIRHEWTHRLQIQSIPPLFPFLRKTGLFRIWQLIFKLVTVGWWTKKLSWSGLLGGRDPLYYGSHAEIAAYGNQIAQLISMHIQKWHEIFEAYMHHDPASIPQLIQWVMILLREAHISPEDAVPVLYELHTLSPSDILASIRAGKLVTGASPD